MLKVLVKGVEVFNQETSTFTVTNDFSFEVEHSLVSVSKWESIYKIPFLTDDEKTQQQMIDYIRCMTITPDVPDSVYESLSNQNLKDIYEYIAMNVTATTVYPGPEKPNRNKEVITSELIYYWMIALNIPFEFEQWHLDRLLTLIKVTHIKTNPSGSKMSKSERAQWMREQNEARQKQLGTTG